MQDRRQKHLTVVKAQRRRIAKIMARVAKGDSLGMIADDLGVSRQRVQQIVKREREKSNEAR